MPKNNFTDIIGLIVALIVFTIILSTNFTATPIEGDEVTTLVYHLGENPAVFQRYAPYQSMVDVVTSYLHDLGVNLEVALFGISIFGAYLFLIVLFFWLIKMGSIIGVSLHLLWYPTLFLFVPEQLFLSLVYNPALFALALLMLGNLLMLKKHVTIFTVIIAGLFVGLGVSFRWDTILFYGVVFGTLIVTRIIFTKMKRTIFFGVCSIIFVILFLYLSGYTISDTFEHLHIFKTLRKNMEPMSFDKRVIKLFALFGTVTIPIIIYAIFHLFKKGSWQIFILIGIALASKMLTGFSNNPKEIIILFPLFYFCLFYGLTKMITLKMHLMKAALVLGLIPWVFGIQVCNEKSAWGPGFEVMIPEHKNCQKKYRFGMFVGSAFSTPEGPRSLAGYAWVFNGGWKKIIQEFTNDRSVLVSKALESSDHPAIFQTGNQKFIIYDLLRKGFKFQGMSKQDGNHIDPTYSKYESRASDQKYKIFYFLKDNKKVSLLIHDGGFLNKQELHEQLKSLKRDHIFVFSFKTEPTSKMKNMFPNSFEYLNAHTGVLKLK